MQNDVPIIGAPQINAWFLTVQVICPCENVPLLLVGLIGAAGQCPRCRKIYTVESVQSNGSHVNISLGVQHG